MISRYNAILERFFFWIDTITVFAKKAVLVRFGDATKAL
jgi:hypothetical protein